MADDVVATAAGLQAVLRSMPGDPRGHEWVEVSAFAGRFCARCGVDEDAQDDIRWNICCPEAAHAAD